MASFGLPIRGASGDHPGDPLADAAEQGKRARAKDVAAGKAEPGMCQRICRRAQRPRVRCQIGRVDGSGRYAGHDRKPEIGTDSLGDPHQSPRLVRRPRAAARKDEGQMAIRAAGWRPMIGDGIGHGSLVSLEQPGAVPKPGGSRPVPATLFRCRIGPRRRENVMREIAWAETLAAARTHAADDGLLLLTYLFAPG